ncbi:MAG: T9SS type A sorting domain-containing protein [Bacteroidales bacterium]|nr:T9SS type A sorting domain-containing protein [Bacteroidales bacterium]MBN2764518.1 T9SS type A sorting domain-containing protein [Bacteroidales bacterium]
MKKFQFQRKILMLLIMIFLILVSENQAQSVKRQCISSYGVMAIAGDAAFAQTVGQPFNTLASSGNSAAILQGFQQPVMFKAEAINSGPLKNLNLNVFPNPATYTVILQSDKTLEKSRIEVTDLAGRIILSEQVTQLQQFELNCGSWKNGIYIITVRDDDQNISSIKVTINK